MAKQNIYDNESFFNGYKKIREKENNANKLFETPTLFSLIPDLKNKKVLDLGCGFGEHCRYFVDCGAKKVVGIDLSQKMLEVAQKENSHPKISYIKMAIEDIDKLNEKFDIIVSSLALHYVEDYSEVVKKIHVILNSGGRFLFSQEHPLATCHSGDDRWTRDESGNKIHLNLSHYGLEGEKSSTWLIENVKKYHRTFPTIINTLIDTGFILEKVVEPMPTDELLEKYPNYRDLFHKPDFLIIKVRKDK